MNAYPRVAVLIESSLMFGRGVLAGIAGYLQEHGPWSVYWEERGRGDSLPSWFQPWQGDGIIARIESRDIADAVRAKNLPTVNLSPALAGLDLPLVQVDNAAVALLAVQHFLERGYRRFGYCGFAGVAYSEQRGRSFQEHLHRAGYTCHVFRPSSSLHHAKALTCERHGLGCETDLLHWLRQLPKPIALFAGSDTRGLQILRACRDLHLAVPEEISVLGVDNDDVLCRLADPPLSSIILDVAGIGERAAELLDRLMKGQAVPKRPLLLGPLGIRARRSTEALAIDNSDVAKAVRFIWARACEGITVADVAAECLLSRRTLERCFVRILGRSPKTEILVVQIQRAKELLAETDLPQTAIALQAGFHHPEYFYKAFKKKVGHSPGEYRSRAQQQR